MNRSRPYSVSMIVMRIQRWLFVGIVSVILAVLLSRAWQMRLFLIDPVIRTKVQATLERTAEERGWLPSDILVRSVTPDRVRVDYRPHHRGAEVSLCALLPFEQTKPIPCAPSQ